MLDPSGQKPVALDQSLAGRRMGPLATRGPHCSLQAEDGCNTDTPLPATPITEAHTQQRKTGTGVAALLWWSGEKSQARVRESTDRGQKAACLLGRKSSYRGRGKTLWWSGENPMVVG